jgi:hypothetical protein
VKDRLQKDAAMKSLVFRSVLFLVLGAVTAILVGAWFSSAIDAMIPPNHLIDRS